MADPFHTHAAILSTGDELVMGQLQDTNARWLAERLTRRGIRVIETRIVGDQLEDLVEAMKQLCQRAPLIVMSGGLGATDGDLTRQAICSLTGDELVNDQAAADRLISYLNSRGRAVTQRQLRQAQRPAKATCLSNTVGTAPGLHVRHGGSDVYCLPGPSGELRPMWDAHVEPRLRPDPARSVTSRLLYATGLPEADAADLVKDLTARGQRITVNLTASGGILTVRTRAEGEPTHELLAQYEQVLQTIRSRLGRYCFGDAAASDTPANQLLCASVLNQLKERHSTLATIESCTGGMLGQILTAVPGSSAAYTGGLVTYSNLLKQNLASVPPDLIAAHGAVSEQTAKAMATGGLSATGAGYALSITGVAGPEGGSADKPVGTVWIGLASGVPCSSTVQTRCFRFPGDRNDVRTRACTSALTMLFFALSGTEPGRLLWQTVP